MEREPQRLYFENNEVYSSNIVRSSKVFNKLLVYRSRLGGKINLTGEFKPRTFITEGRNQNAANNVNFRIIYTLVRNRRIVQTREKIISAINAF